MKHKCLAIFIVSILYLTISTIIFTYEIKTLAKPQIINQTLEESGIYENLPKYVNSLFATNQKMDAQTKVLVETIVKSLNPTKVKSEVEKNTEPLLLYITGKTSQANINFDLTDLKNNLEKNLPASLSQEIANLPPCPAGEEFQKIEGIPSCLPQGTTPAQLEAMLKSTNYTEEIVNKIPDTFTLQNTEKTLSSIKTSYKLLNYLYYFSIILSVILILILVLLGKSWWPSIPRWVGLSLVLPSGTLLLMNVFSNLLPRLLSGQLSKSIDEQIINLLNPVILAANTSTLKISELYGGIVFGLGAILIILSYILPHPPDPSRRRQAEAEPKPTPKPPAQTPTANRAPGVK